MHAIHYVHGLGKPAWIALTILAFMLWWPLGLASAAYGFATRRLAIPERWREHRGGGRAGHWMRACRSSGNVAFDEYRNETLRRLEEEQREFREFLDRLRRARDKAEFDQFMDERRSRPHDPEPAVQG